MHVIIAAHERALNTYTKAICIIKTYIRQTKQYAKNISSQNKLEYRVPYSPQHLTELQEKLHTASISIRTEVVLGFFSAWDPFFVQNAYTR